MNFYFGIVIVALLAISVGATPFKKCNKGVSPLSLKVLGCTDTPCNVYRGKNVTAIADFKTPQDTSVLVPKVKAIVDLWITSYTKIIPFSQKDACSTLTKGQCPLKKGDIITYYFTMPVRPSEKSVNCDIEVSLENKNGDVIACLLLPVSIY